MTLLDERPETDVTAMETNRARRVFSTPTSSWRFASRLARREVRRRPGRTILVMLLVIVPVIGMTVASIGYRSSLASRDTQGERQYGNADLLLFPDDGITDVSDPDNALLGPDGPELPAGSTTTSYVQSWTPVSIEVDGVVTTRAMLFSDVDLNDPITAPTVEVTGGRVPRDAGEVLLSESAAERFDAELGDELRFVRPDMSVTVVGLGLDADSYGNDLIVATGFDRSQFRTGPGGYVSLDTLVDLPDSVTGPQLTQLTADFGEAGVSAVDPQDWAYYDDGQTRRDLAWGWVAGVVSLVAVGIVIAAAFATSARRQLVTIGQLSANGAPERLVRRTMGLQGWWTGLFGSVLGVFLATAGMVIVFRSELAEKFANSRLGTPSIVPLDLIVIVATATAAATIAAMIPARSAARIPVLSALAGRRPVSTPPSWMAPIGVASFVVGLFLLGGAASLDIEGGGGLGGDFPAMLAVIGSLCILAGIVCASPLIVAAVGNVGSRAGGVIRLASRSLGRSRARSAAVLTAIATVGALATVGATVAPTAGDDNGYDPDLSEVGLFYSADYYGDGYDEIVALDDPTASFDPPPVRAPEIPVDVRTGIESILPDAVWTPITQTIIDPPAHYVSSGQELPRDGYDPDVQLIGQAVVVDSAVLDVVELGDEQSTVLDEEGVLALTPYFSGRYALDSPSGPVEIDLRPSLEALGFDGPPETDEEYDRVSQVSLPGGFSGDSVLVSADFVEANEIETDVQSYRIDNPVDLTDAQRDSLYDMQSGSYGDDAFVVEATAAGFESLSRSDGDNAWFPSVNSPASRTPEGLIQLGVIVASLLLVLGVVAIGLSLAATESRDERDVLHAVGASPTTLRRVSAAKAWVLTTGAALVAVPAGYVTIFVISRANDSRAPFPFIVAGALLVGIPLVAAGSTMAVSALASKFRPVTYSALATD